MNKYQRVVEQEDEGSNKYRFDCFACKYYDSEIDYCDNYRAFVEDICCAEGPFEEE